MLRILMMVLEATPQPPAQNGTAMPGNGRTLVELSQQNISPRLGVLAFDDDAYPARRVRV